MSDRTYLVDRCSCLLKREGWTGRELESIRVDLPDGDGLLLLEECRLVEKSISILRLKKGKKGGRDRDKGPLLEGVSGESEGRDLFQVSRVPS